MLALFNSMPLSYTRGKGSWKYPQQQMQGLYQAQQHQPQQQQHLQHHSFQDRVVRNQNQKPFQIPNLLEPWEVPLGNFSIKISLWLDFLMILSRVLKYFKMSWEGCCFKHFDNFHQNIGILWVSLSTIFLWEVCKYAFHIIPRQIFLQLRH